MSYPSNKRELAEYIGWFLAGDSFPVEEGTCALCDKSDEELLKLGDPKGRESESEPEFWLICSPCAGKALAEYSGVS